MAFSVTNKLIWSSGILPVLAVLCFAGIQPLPPRSESLDTHDFSSARFEVEKIGDGVYVIVRKSRPGIEFDGNVVFIVNSNDVIVVDTNVVPSSARETLAALRKLTNKPVKYIVNTHWHDDHIIGNQVWREAFPEVEFIGHASTFRDLPTVGAANRKQILDYGRQYFSQLRSQVEKNKNAAGNELSAEEREGNLLDAQWGDRYLAEAKNFQIIMPTLTVESELSIYRENRVIQIKHLGRAHTAADLVVYLPGEKIVITGDIVVWPIPLVGTTSYPIDYVKTLERLLEIKASTYIPGHGPVMRDDSYVRSMLRLLSSLKQQVEAAVSRGETLEQTRKSVDLSEFKKSMAGDSALKKKLFDDYVIGPGIAGAYRQATLPEKNP